MPIGHCAYCGAQKELTREHVFPRWLRSELDDYPTVTPARGRHLFGGDLVVADVCADCNNGPLSELDETAKRYWDDGLDSAETLSGSVAALMARWAAKVGYNAQRATMALGTAGQEPEMPVEIRPWILADGGCPSGFAVSLTRMPPGHRDREGAGIFGSNGTPLPRRYVQLRGSVFFLAWSVPQVSDAAILVSEHDRRRLPAIDATAGGPTLAVPLIHDPDLVRRGMWRNRELLQQMAKRYPA